MGGGASKANNDSTQPISKDPPSPVMKASAVTNNFVMGPKNGELAPIPASAFQHKNIWNETQPLQPISKGNKPISSEITPILPMAPPSPTRSTSQPNYQGNDLTKATSVIQSTKITPPQPQLQQQAPPPSTIESSPPDPFKNKSQLMERKLSAGINSPIIRYKTSLHGEDKLNSGDDDQVVMDGDEPEGDEYGEEAIDEPTMDFGGKSSADQYYADMAEKSSKPSHIFAQPMASVLSNHSMQSIGSAGSQTNFGTIQMSEEEETGLYTEYGDYKASNILSNSKKIISVPTLKLADLGHQTRAKPANSAIVPSKTQEVPVVIKHGNFDNSKFRAANAKKKNATDSIFQQTTYDYKAANKSTSHSHSAPSSGPTSLRSSHDSVDSTSFGYSSDTSMESPDHHLVMRPPTTPTHKPAYDDFEETLISSILDDSQIESPA